MGEDRSPVDAARLALALAASESGVYDVDLSTGDPDRPGQVSMDERSLALLEVDTAAWDGRLATALARVHADDVQRLRAGLEAAVASEAGGVDPADPADLADPVDLVVRLRVVRRDGVARELEARGRVVVEATGHRLVGIVTDITGRADAALTEQQRQVTATLRRTLLPALPALERLDAAVRYRPRAGAGDLDVGGEWLDLIDLGAGRTAVAIGDVRGRGAQAMAVMGQLRAAVRAYAQLDLPPAEVLTLLDRVVGQLGDATLVTCLFGVLDSSSGTLRLAGAGHVAPIVVGPDSTVVPLDLDPSPPLGSDQPDYEERGYVIPAQHVLAFFTDGLVGSGGSAGEDGVRRLSQLLAARAGAGLEGLADEVLATLGTSHDQDDDAALLLVRTTTGPAAGHVVPAPVDRAGAVPQPLSMTLSSGPTAAREGRRLLAEHVGRWRLSTPALDTAGLVLSELATNAMLHGAPPITVSLRPGDGVLFIEVADGGRYRPHRRVAGPLDEGGRGLELVQALSRQWGVRPRLGGKVVWAEIAMNEPRTDIRNSRAAPDLDHGQPRATDHRTTTSDPAHP